MASVGLIPSQAVRSTSSGDRPNTASASNSNTSPQVSSSSGGNNGDKKKGRQRRRNKNKTKTKVADANGNNETSTNENDEGKKSAQNQARGKNQRRRNNNNKKNQGEEHASSNDEGQKPKQKNNGKQNNNNNNKKRNNKKNRKRFPWRRHIPAGTVDPITLDSLVSLPYPPFALWAAGPYLPVPVWPPTEHNETQQKTPEELAKEQALEAQERERRLLQEQWGNAVVSEGNEPASSSMGNQGSGVVEGTRHVNLFDGRALAYYMVSQLQFIDPLTRRDLDRDELIHLDRYLTKHGFTNLNVVEAYDTKGVSLSTAGAASTTAAGRAEILQQEARVLLNALFGGGAAALPPPPRNDPPANPLMEQYSNYQAAQQQQQRQQPPSAVSNNNNRRLGAPSFEEDAGVYGDETTGMMVIDDDMNPSLRGAGDTRGLRPHRPAHGPASAPPTLWVGSRITGPGANASNLQPQNFPALSATTTLPPHQSPLNTAAPAFVPGGGTPAAEAPAAPQKKKHLPPANTLKFIAGSVKKTTPEEAQRQFEAREEARRKAMLSNLTFGSNPAMLQAWPAAGSAAPTMPSATEGQLERNRAFADALGVSGPKPTPQSWARPTETALSAATTYPDELILRARENMGPLLKLEKKWKAFLEDDKAASLPLNHMDRPMRAFVHHYSDHWKLHTESFDQEPKRYIHCVKLLDTAAPYPLLSDAARHWRGPTGAAPIASDRVSSQQTAGQDTWGREIRAPVVTDLSAVAAATNPRAAALASARPKLELKERTLPLELPPFVPAGAAEPEFDTEEQIRRRKQRAEEQKRKEEEREERKQRALEAAFASDSEEESLRDMGEDDDDSDWEEREALYTSDDEAY